MENLSSFLGKMPYRGPRGPQPGSERPDPQAGAAGSQGGTTRRLQETGLSHDFRARQSLPADLEMEGCSTRETRAARRRLFPTAAVAGSCRLRPGKGGPAAPGSGMQLAGLAGEAASAPLTFALPPSKLLNEPRGKEHFSSGSQRRAIREPRPLSYFQFLSNI